MRIIRFVPGHIISPAAITLPVTAPDIDAVVGAEITRIPTSFVLAHTDSGVPVPHADGVDVAHANMAVDPHADHPHDIAVGAAVVAAPYGASGVAANDIVDGAGALIPGGGATGVQDYLGAAIPHAVTQPDDHPAADIAAALIHNGADIAAALIDHANSGITPVVPGAPYDVTRLSTRTFSLNVDTELGDLLTLAYLEVGERVLVS
jgi:hypothetical protein